MILQYSMIRNMGVSLGPGKHKNALTPNDTTLNLTLTDPDEWRSEPASGNLVPYAAI